MFLGRWLLILLNAFIHASVSYSTGHTTVICAPWPAYCSGGTTLQPGAPIIHRSLSQIIHSQRPSFSEAHLPQSQEMSSAVCATWRLPCSRLQASRALPLVTLSPASRDLRIAPPWRLSSNISRRPFGSLYHFFHTEYRPTPPSIHPPCRIRTTVSSRMQTTSTPLDPKPKKLRDDNTWEDPFTTTEIKKIYGHTRKISPKLGNRVLALLHSRRLSGTLDINLPAEVTRTVPQSQIDKALEWLRANYPVDEDACIMQRIEREELEDEEKYNYHPQSGSYGAQLGEQNDAYGRSVFQKMREKNEKQYFEEEERKRKAWLEGEAQEYEQMRRQVKGNTKLQKFEEAAVVEGKRPFPL